MSISKELNARLFENAEEQRIHVEYRSEYGYYGAVADGDIEAVRKVLVSPGNVSLYENGEYGTLSKDRLRSTVRRITVPCFSETFSGSIPRRFHWRGFFPISQMYCRSATSWR